MPIFAVVIKGKDEQTKEKKENEEKNQRQFELFQKQEDVYMSLIDSKQWVRAAEVAKQFDPDVLNKKDEYLLWKKTK